MEKKLEDLKEWMEEREGTVRIIIGDFNARKEEEGGEWMGKNGRRGSKENLRIGK